MLIGKHVVFLGGDARQLEVIKSCIEMNAKVSLIGFDNLQSPFSGATQRRLTKKVLSQADILVLPIIGTDDQGKISSVFTSEEIYLTEEHIKALPSHCLLFTGLAKTYLKNLCESNQVNYFELMMRDDVAIYNSIPTVEGALMMAIQNADITLHDSQTIVLGLGRVGLSLARVLQAIGAHVKVGVRKSDDYARAFEMGLNPFYTSELGEQVENADFIFNTVPAVILDSAVLSHSPYDVVIIDLASKPGGVDFEFAKKRGIKAILAPSLPGIVAPKTAGKIIARTMMKLMVENVAEEGNLQ
ncbi:dipicolinate synthase subunit A [Croceifilum oryzae]|uniref:Dipicolinate synthase subunit A n=1 Tax=Croceifilum oryzae TaxID=1553429 RepID=A0AAJ1TLK1_9BACL|nr:dipicolinate synthase subunit DpsA [Croceifilum oryzae]MDQ0416896.1 dipicolinate synthase subunit A [Croceifilum oryzae]